MFNLENSPFDPSKFADMFKFDDMSKMFEMPSFEGKGVMDAHQKNVEALTKAQEIATSGYQSLVEKQIAMAQDAMNDVQAQIAELSKAPSATDAVTKQTELMKAAYDKALANMNELAEMAQKTNTDAFGVLKGRIEASIEEFKVAA